MKKCEHCGKDCIRRVPRMVRNRIAMVGTGCAKNFKAPKRSDLSADLAIISPVAYAGEPTPVSMKDFGARFPKYEQHTMQKLSQFGYGYIWKGRGILLSHSGSDSDRILITEYDPYTGVDDFSVLVYKTSLLGPIVSQLKDPGTPGFKKSIQDMLDAYPKWDPLAKYGIKMPGTAIIPVAAPIAAIPTGTARTTKFTSWSDPNLGMVAVNPGSFSPFVRYSPFVRRLFNNVNVHFHDIETDPTAKGPFQYKRITFGIMPSRSDFDIAFNNKVALVNKQYYYLDLSKLMSNLRLLHYNQIVTGNYRVNELYDLLEKLTTSNDPYQFRLAGSILFTLGFEWP